MINTEVMDDATESRLFDECNGGHPDDHWVLDPLCHAQTMVGPHWRKRDDPPICGFPADGWEHNPNNKECHTFVAPTEPLVWGENAWRHDVCPSWEETTEHGEQIGDQTWYAKITRTVCYCICHASRIYVNVYELEQGYGGPEEGGWYYEAGVPVSSILCDNVREAEATVTKMKERYPETKQRYSVRPQKPDYGVYIETHFASPFPEQTPRYS